MPVVILGIAVTCKDKFITVVSLNIAIYQRYDFSLDTF
jgi:hypothetical protein